MFASSRRMELISLDELKRSPWGTCVEANDVVDMPAACSRRSGEEVLLWLIRTGVPAADRGTVADPIPQAPPQNFDGEALRGPVFTEQPAKETLELLEAGAAVDSRADTCRAETRRSSFTALV
mmetsp:Transcript_38016/g.61270  ORF Transcript_38016/g.61270 Transcript_38016/m.61270 type:complete len:123 (+) Transcript_38016:227-595(+)